MREINAIFTSRPKRNLHHYTGIGSLLGISTNSVLWASNIYYLNDSKEIHHAIDVLHGAVEPLMLEQLKTDEEREFGRQFLVWMKSFSTQHYNLFVFSLSEHQSLLSQWRSYTPHGKGIRIAFKPEFLEKIIQANNLVIAPCAYTPTQHESILKVLFGHLLTTFRQDKPQVDPKVAPKEQCYFQFLENFRGQIMQVLAIIKHQAFAEEAEWRLISAYHPSYVVPTIFYREGASLLVPYVKLALGNERPYFASVMLGPSEHTNLSHSALQNFLSNQKLTNVTINCLIPHREWA